MTYCRLLLRSSRFLLYARKYAVFWNQLYFPDGPIFTIQHLWTYYFAKKKTVLEGILFADDTSVVIAGRNCEDFCLVSNLVFFSCDYLISSNNVVINLDKINKMKFITEMPLIQHRILVIVEYKQVRMNKNFLF